MRFRPLAIFYRAPGSARRYRVLWFTAPMLFIPMFILERMDE